MTATTIKVDSALRDRLKEQARREGHGLGAHIEHLLEREERRLRMIALRDAIAATPQSELDSYAEETAELDQAFGASGLPAA